MSPAHFHRRDVLRTSAIGLASGVAGCVRFSSPEPPDPPPFGPPGTDWPMYGYDHGTTGHSPNATGPQSEPTLEWGIEPSDGKAPGFAIHDDIMIVSGDDTLRCFDLTAGEQRWSTDIEGPAGVALDAECCYVRGDGTQLNAYRLDDGGVQWKVNADGELLAPVLSDGEMYVLDGSEVVRSIDTNTGDVQWQTTVESDIFTNSPTICHLSTDGTYLAVSTFGTVVVLDTDNGTERVRLPSASRPVGVIVADGVLYLSGRTLRAWDIERDELLWEQDLESLTTYSIGLSRDIVYAGVDTFRMFDRASGEPRSQIGLDSREMIHLPVRGENTVFIASGQGGILSDINAIDVGDTSLQWHLNFDGGSAANLAVVGDRLLVAAVEGGLYSFSD
ncbi:PQQ-binding-like beta-propeller repeat protein [Natranaeroarchaeum aerophilus]|uniref:PQQ-like beta-propeller repeat protein n=1 Tax=Natranaeroarchaeum aerophilus TaxID=2917711 RepID=A0AAE3K5R7_9EURY|nr:PQQ-binding-like beta-propeller repeat protein [Natranaeroarchaeum aerophilus]MCL9813625.1 PQQ-like beta-propeller repeat protein [Natranaeroarchaeum aerophilus]